MEREDTEGLRGPSEPRSRTTSTASTGGRSSASWEIELSRAVELARWRINILLTREAFDQGTPRRAYRAALGALWDEQRGRSCGTSDADWDQALR